MTTDKDEEVLAALEGYDEEPEQQDELEVEEPEQQPDPQPDPEPQATDWEAIAREKGWAPQQQEQPQPQPEPDYTADLEAIAYEVDPVKQEQLRSQLVAKQLMQTLAPMLAPVVQQSAVQAVTRLSNAEPELAPYIEELTKQAGIAGNVSKEQAEFIADAARGRALRTGAIKPQPQATKRVVNTTNASPVQATVTQTIPTHAREDAAKFEEAFKVKVDGAFIKRHGIEL
jgi:hypothetical protein